MSKKILELMQKYERFVYNIEWHIETNKPLDSELEKFQNQLKAYKEIVADLRRLLIVKKEV